MGSGGKKIESNVRTVPWLVFPVGGLMEYKGKPILTVCTEHPAEPLGVSSHVSITHLRETNWNLPSLCQHN